MPRTSSVVSSGFGLFLRIRTASVAVCSSRGRASANRP